MLPIISEEFVQTTVDEVTSDLPSWRKNMIHYIKDNNPEVNSLLVELANRTGLDPKALATGAYAVYRILEEASFDGADGDFNTGE